MRTTYLVCYDIADDKRLRKVFKTCGNFGDHLQFSVFECDLNPSEKVELETALIGIINHDEDQVIFVVLGPSEGGRRPGDHRRLISRSTRSWMRRVMWFETLVIFDN